jgi:hypothetical protein
LIQQSVPSDVACRQLEPPDIARELAKVEQSDVGGDLAEFDTVHGLRIQQSMSPDVACRPAASDARHCPLSRELEPSIEQTDLALDLKLTRATAHMTGAADVSDHHDEHNHHDLQASEQSDVARKPEESDTVRGRLIQQLVPPRCRVQVGSF